MSTTYDLVVIGAGPGGYVAAARAAALGLKTALVEKDDALGGTCLHRGCIPTKALLHAADLYGEMRQARQIGIAAEGVRVDWRKVQHTKQRIVTTNAGGVRHLMSTRGVDVHHGFGTLEGPKRVRVVAGKGKKAATLATRNVLLAVGSTPRALPMAAFDHPSGRVISSDGILQLSEIPGSLVIIGGGVIGVEFASLFVRFGAQVTVLEAAERLLPGADADCSRELQRQLAKQGVRVHTSARVGDISPRKQRVAVGFTDANGRQLTCDGDFILVAVGRAPLTQGIGLEQTQARVDDRGYVRVNGWMQTEQDGLYAIGDCVDTPWLAHVASAEGIIAVEHMAGHQPAALNHDHIPSCVYSDPPVAQCGLTQQQARQEGYDVKTSVFPFTRSGKASILGKKEGFVKFVTEARYGEILGVHIIGPQATELIAEPAFAMQLEATVEDIARSVHAHPTLYESIYEAAALAADRAIHG